MIGLALFELALYKVLPHTHTHTMHCTNSRVLNTLSILLSADKGIVEEWSLFDQPYLYGKFGTDR